MKENGKFRAQVSKCLKAKMQQSLKRIETLTFKLNFPKKKRKKKEKKIQNSCIFNLICCKNKNKKERVTLGDNTELHHTFPKRQTVQSP